MNSPVKNGGHPQQIQSANGAGGVAKGSSTKQAGLRFKALSTFALGKPPQKRK